MVRLVSWLRIFLGVKNSDKSFHLSNCDLSPNRIFTILPVALLITTAMELFTTIWSQQE